MFLAIDVGNTNIVLGLYDGTKLLDHWRLQTQAGRTADEYGVIVRSLLACAGDPKVTGIAIGSVVPPINRVLDTLCNRYIGCKPLFIGPGVRTGLPILYDKPQEVGADRVVNAVAAYHRTHAATIVVDFGTATTFDFVSAKGEYVGGVIAPGLEVSGRALFERAAKLSPVDMVIPKGVIGRNTAHAIQSGLMYGYVALVDGLIARIQKETQTRGRVIATGGLATMLAPESERIDEVDEFLTLDGLRLVYERNAE